VGAPRPGLDGTRLDGRGGARAAGRRRAADLHRRRLVAPGAGGGVRRRRPLARRRPAAVHRGAAAASGLVARRRRLVRNAADRGLRRAARRPCGPRARPPGARRVGLPARQRLRPRGVAAAAGLRSALGLSPLPAATGARQHRRHAAALPPAPGRPGAPACGTHRARRGALHTVGEPARGLPAGADAAGGGRRRAGARGAVAQRAPALPRPRARAPPRARPGARRLRHAPEPGRVGPASGLARQWKWDAGAVARRRRVGAHRSVPPAGREPATDATRVGAVLGPAARRPRGGRRGRATLAARRCDRGVAAGERRRPDARLPRHRPGARSRSPPPRSRPCSWRSASCGSASFPWRCSAPRGARAVRRAARRYVRRRPSPRSAWRSPSSAPATGR
jgi:hypothetical protein